MCAHALGFAAASQKPHKLGLDVVIILGDLLEGEKFSLQYRGYGHPWAYEHGCG